MFLVLVDHLPHLLSLVLQSGGKLIVHVVEKLINVWLWFFPGSLQGLLHLLLGLVSNAIFKVLHSGKRQLNKLESRILYSVPLQHGVQYNDIAHYVS